MKHYRRVAAFGIAMLSAIFISEGLLRFTAFNDFPTFRQDECTKYIIAPSQKGKFMAMKTFNFDWKSMEHFNRGESGDVDYLLVGDSVVFGGLAVSEHDKVGAFLSDTLQKSVETISTPGWSLINELNYLNCHSNFLNNYKTIIFVVNSEDFDSEGYLTSEILYPTQRPVSLLWYIFQRKVYQYFSPEMSGSGIAARAVSMPELRTKWEQFLHTFRGHVVMVGHYKRDEVIKKSSEVSSFIFGVTQTGGREIDVVTPFTSSEWSTDLYADEIHLKQSGSAVLGRLIASYLTEHNF